MYCIENVNCICLECIANSKAAEKFDGEFIQHSDAEVSDKSKIEELFKRTPGYVSWQGEHWLTCYDDYCAFISDVGTAELEKMGIADEVFAEYDAKYEFDNAREYLKKLRRYGCIFVSLSTLWQISSSD